MVFRTITLDCACWTHINAGTVDGIARLHLATRRSGIRLRLENASYWLVDLIDFCGLGEVLRIQPGRQVEKWEQPGRIEEEGDVGDSALRQLDHL